MEDKGFAVAHAELVQGGESTCLHQRCLLSFVNGSLIPNSGKCADHNGGVSAVCSLQQILGLCTGIDAASSLCLSFLYISHHVL